MKIIKIILVSLLCLIAAYYTLIHFLQASSLVLTISDVHVDQSLPDEKQTDSQDFVHVQLLPVASQQNEDTVQGNNLQGENEAQAVVEVQSIHIKPVDSFVTMPVLHGSQLDQNTQQTFDMLIGNNIDHVLDLIVQSNNNVLSTDSCRSCAIDAILKKVSKHKKLSEHEIVSLQHVVENLYKFVNTMQKLSNKTILTSEQYLALKNLNTSQVSMKQIAMQARQAATIAALQSLKNIDMVQRQG